MAKDPASEDGAAAAVSAAPSSPEPREEEEEEELVPAEPEKRDSEEMRAEDLRVRMLEKQRKLVEDEEARILSARLRLEAESQNEVVNAMKMDSLELQRRAVSLQKKRKSTDLELFILRGQDAHYYACLREWNETKEEFNKMKNDFDRKIDTLRDMLQEKAEEAIARHEELIAYFWQVAKDSQDIVSSQKISTRLLKELEQEERDSITELQAVRTRGRQLKNQLGKLELRLAMKDQLQGENGTLRLVDYEQLKMENQALDDKIQVKNDALSKLRKKTAFLVHTLQHIREKLQFLAVVCKEKGHELANAENALHEGRLKNAHLRITTAHINRKKEALTRGEVKIKSRMICDDMDVQREDILAEEQTTSGMQRRYRNLTAQIQGYRTCLYNLKVIPVPMKKPFTREKPETPPIERGSLRWGNKRVLPGQDRLKQPLC